MVYGSARPSVLRRFDTIHHSALRICSGAFRTSPTESLYNICHQLPLYLRRKKITSLYYFRTQSLPKHPISELTLPASVRRIYDAHSSCIPPFSVRIETLLRDSGLNNSTINSINHFYFPPWDKPEFSFLNPFFGFEKSATASVVFQQLFFYHRCQYSSFIPVFTDGSKSDGHVGFGIVLPSAILSYRLHTSFSIFTAELIAISYALQEISISTNRSFVIYTDSLSALETLSHPDNQMHPVALKF
ncbi:uncharacterized protein LOC129962897 [Argiope bruennichi]|uniref:uncharacterized protein LOC129962897 n=1 Tax=Argiope bruennichi TaxID=94029 RepID=UPI0024942C9B|nr:uncharacterized protein LOC129962897 [Argiope bruennichi]